MATWCERTKQFGKVYFSLILISILFIIVTAFISKVVQSKNVPIIMAIGSGLLSLLIFGYGIALFISVIGFAFGKSKCQVEVLVEESVKESSEQIKTE